MNPEMTSRGDQANTAERLANNRDVLKAVIEYLEGGEK